ncbi:MAG TPA: N-acetylmuramic acid 6-phosphate etherase [Roseimicrobium sp.]|nr:N-acetylmuramic acid 6-phosphate etherase [Roseimicrobium sp.]
MTTTVSPCYLGIEAGGTRTTVLLADAKGQTIWAHEAGPANLRLLSDTQLARHFRSLQPGHHRPAAIAIGMAGARTESDRERIRRTAAKVWKNTPCIATNDLETALLAAPEVDKAKARILILSGTGSCCFGRDSRGRTAKIGGWGHILGDKGSGFEIGLRALKAVVYYYDRDGEWSKLGQRILRVLQLNEPNDLIGWAQQADKTSIAALAVEVFEAAALKDAIARDILAGAAHSLAKDAAACARRLAESGARVQFVLAGGILLKQPRFAAAVGRYLKTLWPKAVVTPLKQPGVRGAVELAKLAAPKKLSTDAQHVATISLKIGHSSLDSLPKALSPTEQRNPKSMELDTLSIPEAVELMLSEDAGITRAIRREKDRIALVIEKIVVGMSKGGRLFYVGAGTSGRLGVLDASECPPTFRTPPELVQGIIAGGQRALWQAVEGAEDDYEAGGRSVEFRGVGRNDVVVGIAASGRTPFVWGAMRTAKARGAFTALVCFNPHMEEAEGQGADIIVAPRIGPEVLTGSTRLKSGTATKLILNMFTTLAMVRLGKVVSNLMVDVHPSNVKLRDRAVRILHELTGAPHDTARAALVKNGWKVKETALKLRRTKAKK